MAQYRKKNNKLINNEKNFFIALILIVIIINTIIKYKEIFTALFGIITIIGVFIFLKKNDDHFENINKTTQKRKEEKEKKHYIKDKTMKLLTVTEVGRIFNKSSRQMNEAFSELNWIEKVDNGWKLKKDGEINGGKQINFKGQLSVKWEEKIKDNNLLKNLFKPKQEKIQKTSYKEKVQKGKEYEIYVGKYFEEKGYITKYNGIENGVKDNSVDIIAIKKDEIIFIQCKNWKADSKYKITHKDIKAFLGDIYMLIIENERYQGYKEKRLFVASNEIFDTSAIKYCEEHKNVIDYMCLKMENKQI